MIQGIDQSHKLGLVVSSTTSATKYSPVAQLVEHLTVNQVVGGSIPPWGAKLNKFKDAYSRKERGETVNLLSIGPLGSIPRASTS